MKSDAVSLLQFNRQLLDQALALVDAHDAPGAPVYAHYAGPQLRHVIEHYEALLFAPRASIVDYDTRARDRKLEQDPGLARERLLQLARHLKHWPQFALAAPIAVHTRGGPSGEFEFVTRSSVGRELVYVASHAVHHFALLQIYCVKHGISMAANFGKAAATVAHEMRSRASLLN